MQLDHTHVPIDMDEELMYIMLCKMQKRNENPIHTVNCTWQNDEDFTYTKHTTMFWPNRRAVANNYFQTQLMSWAFIQLID